MGIKMRLQVRLLLDNLQWKIEDLRDYQYSGMLFDSKLEKDLDSMENYLKLLETDLRQQDEIFN